MNLPTPATLGQGTDWLGYEKYRPILEIGHGGMSSVFLAVVRGPGDFNKLQVVKRLLHTLAADPEFLEMFLEEARLSARLNHSNIVQINEVGFDGTHHFMAMEYLEGQPLDSIVRRTSASKDERFTVPMHLRIIAEACAGLHHAHELADIDGTPLNVVHRDVSPHNVFVTYSGQVKVIDFGIAKAADSSHQTRTGVLKGKCSYMAPEQFRAERIDRRADIFALGVMVWQAITRTRLWNGLSDIEIFHRLAHGEIPSPLTIDPYLPSPLVHICERALAPNPVDRYRSAVELSEAIDTYLASVTNPANTRDIGRYVSELFSDSRAKVKSAIEAELRKSQNTPQGAAEIPIFVDPNVLPSAELSPASPFSSASSASSVSSASHPRGQAFIPGSAREALGEAGSFGMVAGGRRDRSKDVLKGLLAVCVTVGLAVAGAFFLQQRSAEGPVAVTPPAAEPAPTPAAVETTKPVAEERFTVLKARAVPESAVIYVDEVQLSSNPGTARFVRDGLTHRIRAEAAGHKGRIELVVYDRAEQDVLLKLDRNAPLVTRPVGRANVTRPSATPTASTPPVASTVTPPVAPPAPTPPPTNTRPPLDPWQG